jgi:hypothetical protein
VTFTAIVSPSSGAGAPSGVVTFSIDGKAQSPIAVALVHGHEEATFATSKLSVGMHSISATYAGDSTFGSSTVVTPLVQTVIAPPTRDSPTVALVQRFGVHMEPTVLVVTFDGALDQTNAQDVKNYVIVGPSGRHIAIDSAVYDASTSTVTLRPGEKINLHHNYQFTIVAAGPNGVKGAEQSPLDATGDGGPGTNFVSTLNWKDVVLSPAQARKIHAQSHRVPAGALAHRFVSRKR